MPRTSWQRISRVCTVNEAENVESERQIFRERMAGAVSNVNFPQKR